MKKQFKTYDEKAANAVSHIAKTCIHLKSWTSVVNPLRTGGYSIYAGHYGTFNHEADLRCLDMRSDITARHSANSKVMI